MYNSSIQSKLKENPKKLKYTPPPLVDPISNKQWAAFITLQLLDVYTTHQATQYNCVEEINPILGQKPSIGKMILIKTLVLAPAIRADLNNQTITPKHIRDINAFMTAVSYNNYRVYNKAQKYCKKT
jgi:hypothetical protein